jgi:putative transposase|nr:MAG TPA: endonuclease [Caudoviricetes sp.]
MSRKTRVRNDNLSDAAMGEILTLLKRKGEEYGVPVVAIGQYKKSTQTCSKCGFVNVNTKDTKIRGWICPECGAIHDRDINAAINILNMAKEKEYKKQIA